jgi:hypothetical protein
VGGLLLGVVLFVLSVVGTAVVTTLAWKLITAINPAYRVWTGRGYYGSDWHLPFLAALSAAFNTAVYLLARRFIRAARDDEGVAAGALIVLALLAILTGRGCLRSATSSPGPPSRACWFSALACLPRRGLEVRGRARPYWR